jgi:dihydropteroate synthase
MTTILTAPETVPSKRPALEAGLYLRPMGVLRGRTAEAGLATGLALPLGGPKSGQAFTLVEILRRAHDQPNGMAGTILPVSNLDMTIDALPAASRMAILAQRDRLCAPLPAWAGFDLGRPLIMAVLNVTPDSFSDGGDFFGDVPRAVDRARQFVDAGADIVDIGGESTRPGADPVPPEEEIARVVPIVTRLAAAGLTVSIDTRHAQVMAAALDAGAKIVNDVSGLRDPAALALVAARRVPVVIMHMQGDPRSMQAAPGYEAVALDIFDYLEERLAAVAGLGLPSDLCLVDPGIGFGKTLPHNLDLMSMLGLYRALGCGVLLGGSRKSTIQQIMGVPISPKRRLSGSLALALAAYEGGAGVIRVHDVAETVQALSVWNAVRARG